MDIQILDFQPPKVVINYEELKAELENLLNNYRGLIVTKDTLDGSKQAQKELAGLRVKIDKYRKDKKKELEVPIKTFENQCKELISIVEQVEKPIKEGIKVFDDERKEEKRKVAQSIADDVAKEVGLNDKYTSMLDVIDKYTNATITNKAIREDLETRAFALKICQEKDIEKTNLVKMIIETENKNIKTKISFEDYLSDIESEKSVSDIITDIKAKAELIHKAENQSESNVEDKNGTNTQAEDKKPNLGVNQSQNEQFKVTFEVVGTKEQQHMVADFMKSNNIYYKVTSQLKA